MNVSTPVTLATDEGRQVQGDAQAVGGMFEWVFHDSPDAILLTAPDGRIFRANPAAIKLFGWSEEELVAGGRDLVVDTSDPRLGPALAERAEKGKARSELTFRHRDGTLFAVDISSAIFDTNDGARTVMVIRDLRPQKELEARLAREAERFRLLAENAQDIVYRYQVEPEPRFDYVSPAVTRITGYTPEEHYADPALGFRLVHPDDRSLLDEVADGKLTRVAIRWIRKDGTVIWTEHTATPIRDASGRVVAIEGIARDVTDRKRIEEQLERERARLSLLAEASARMAGSLEFEETLSAVARAALPAFADYCIVDLLDDDGQFRRVAAAAADAEQEAALRDIAAEHGPSASARHPSAIAVATRKPVLLSEIPESVFEALVPDDTKRRSLRARFPAGSAIAVPLIARGKCFGAVMFSAIERGRFGASDVQVAEELGHRASLFLDNARLYGEAQRALVARDEILSVVAHDLRNPLNAIFISSEIVSRSPLEESIRNRVEAIQRNVKNMDALIQDLLDVTRCEAGALRMEQTVATPDAIVADACEVLQPLAGAASVELVVEVEQGTPPVRVDRKRILQVLSNLVGNALKFTGHGTRIHIEVSRGPREVRFCVRDEGPGIPPAQLEHVFERFWQGEGASKRGLGLGLPIVRALVEQLGGHVWAESELGMGTRMYFALPEAA